MKKKFGRLLLLFASAALISSAPVGCKSKPKDEDLRASVETALRANPGTSGVMVSVKDRVVTLSGETTDESAKTRASELATSVKGVESVQNNVTIAAPATAPVEITADDALTTAVRDATKDYPTVTATVKDGVISLSGEIKQDSWRKLKQTLDGLKPKKVDPAGLKISK